MNPDDPYADLTGGPGGHATATDTTDPYADLTGAPVEADPYADLTASHPVPSAKPDTAPNPYSDPEVSRIFARDGAPAVQIAKSPGSAPIAPEQPGFLSRVGTNLESMAEPFKPKNPIEAAIPFAAAGRGLAETAYGVGKMFAQSAGTALSPVVGEERRNNLRAPQPSLGLQTGTYDAEHGAVTEQARNEAGLQLGATAAAGPLGELAGGVAGKFLPRVAAHMVGGAAGAAPLMASYSPQDPWVGAATGAIVGGGLGAMLSPLQAAELKEARRAKTNANMTALAGTVYDIASHPTKPLPTAEPPAPVAPPAPDPRDIAQLIQQRDEARRQAETSSKTGLPNDVAFARAKPVAESDPNTAIVRLDINNMKAANDALGHPFVDANVLPKAAESMQLAAQQTGIPARAFHLHGDEFAAIVPSEHAAAYRDAVEQLYGVQDHGNGVKTSLSGGIGQTDVDADADSYVRKSAQKQAQGIGPRSASSSVATVPTGSLTVDPDRFQFKQNVDQGTGTGAELKGVQTFNPDLAGVLSVWHDPEDGNTYVVNGHHRHELAQRTGTPSLDVRYLDAPDAQAARAKGALINIAEGRGTPLDAAKYFRDTGTTPDRLAEVGVSMRNATATRGLAIAKLAPDLFDRVARGEIPEETAASVGKVLDAPEQQRAALGLIERGGKRLSPAEIENVARQVRDAGSTTATQETLFGKEETSLSLAVDRARLAESFKKDIAKDARLFGFVAREGRAEELARGGNVIDVGASGRLAQESAQHSEVFDRLATRGGPIADILTEGARRLANGEGIADIKADIGPRVRAAISETVAGRAGAESGAHQGDVSERGVVSGNEGRAGNGPNEAEEGHVVDSRDESQGGMFSQEPTLRTVPGPHGGTIEAKLQKVGDNPPGFDVLTYRDATGTQRAEMHVFLDESGRGTGQSISVDPGWQRKGIGSALYDRAENLGYSPLENVGKRTGLTDAGEAFTNKMLGVDEDPYAPSLHESIDLFGQETPDEPTQGGLFGDRAGTAASRSLREVEADARARIPALREFVARSTDLRARTAAAQELAQLERLVNRAGKVTPDELRARVQAGEGEMFGAHAPGDPYSDLTGTTRRTLGDGPLRSADVQPPSSATPGHGATPFADVSRGAEHESVAEGSSPADAATTANKYTDAWRRIFDVSSRTENANTTGLTIREHAAERAMSVERAIEALRSFAKSFSKMPDGERLDFIDRIETGQEQPSLALSRAARTIRGLLDQARDQIQALGTGKLETFYQDYFPHLWADPEEAERVIGSIMGKRTLTGPGSFLKKRTIVTMRDGIEAGLTPLTTNPIDATMLKLREMHRYLMGQRIMEEMKSRGLARFVSAFEEAPDGFEKIDDKIGKVYGPPVVTVTEAYDKLAREKIEGIMTSLGMQHTRGPRIGGTRLGYYEQGTGHITTKAGTPMDVLYHEFGHALDDRYGLWDYLLEPTNKGPEAIADRKVLQNELRALADSRFEGQDPGPGFRGYVRNKYEKMAVTVQAYLHAPELMREVAPTIMARFRQFVEEHPELHDVLDVKPSLVHGTATHEIPVGGMVIKGNYYAPEAVTSVLNNFLSPGLRGHPFYDAYMGVGNVLNQAQLGLSAFHLGFTSMDATVSKAALGIEQMMGGRPLQGLGSLARANIATAPIENYLRGSKVLKESLRPGTQGADMAAIVDGLVKGGGRVRMDDFYKNSSAASFFDALKDGKRAAKEMPSLRASATLAGVPIRAAWHGLGAALQAASYPILEHIVPRQKLGVFADLAQHELARLPAGASPDMVRSAMSKAWDSVDNRMGQLVYDNLFWHRATKDIAMASVRSVGWNIGTIRELGGGALDAARVPGKLLRGDGSSAMTHRLAYVAALPAVVALHGAILHYLMNGQGPQTLKDYFYPRTGRTNPDGTSERIQLPSYMKDVFAYAEHPYDTIKHKLHPLIAALSDMLENENYHGDEIRNPDDPIVKQLAQEAEFIAAQFKPMGIQNAQDARSRGQPLAEQAAAFIGVTPAPRSVTRTAAQSKMSDFLNASGPSHLTPEQQDTRDERRTLTSGLRSGDPNARAKVGDAIRSGDLTVKSGIKTLKSGLTSTTDAESFKRLTAQQAVTVWSLGTEDEKRRWKLSLITKIARARQNGQHVDVPPGLIQ